MDGHLTAEISTSAVRDNMAVLRGLLGEGVKLCPAVKANCYGHGTAMLLETICRSADMLGVATAQEAIELRDMGCDLPILVFLSPFGWGPDGDALEELIARNVTLTLGAPGEVEMAAAAARRAAATVDVHVNIDTGMNRSGVPVRSAETLVSQVRAAGGLQLRGLYTHFASADEADKTSAKHQLKCFKQIVSTIGREGLVIHAANSAAVIDLPESHLDMVRPGISVYGYQPSDEMHRKVALRPALRLTGRLLLVKDVPAGGRCGYGLTYTFEKPGRIGLVPIGYADGYLRCLSNRSTMRVCGCDVPVRGRVSMDQTIVDLSDVPQAEAGDEVEIISSDGASRHSVENLARLAGTIPYEITTRLGRRVRRRARGDED